MSSRSDRSREQKDILLMASAESEDEITAKWIFYTWPCLKRCICKIKLVEIEHYLCERYTFVYVIINRMDKPTNVQNSLFFTHCNIVYLNIFKSYKNCLFIRKNYRESIKSIQYFKYTINELLC